MTEDEALSLLEAARPIFEMAGNQQWFELENNLKYGEYALLENINQVWYAGWTGYELEGLCRRAEFKPAQVKAVSVYMWNKLLTGNYQKRENSALIIVTIFTGLTIIGTLILGTILYTIFGYIPTIRTSGRYNPNEIYYAIGFVLCAPITATGYFIQTKVQARQVKCQRTEVLDGWPKGLYPGNVAPDEAI